MTSNKKNQLDYQKNKNGFSLLEIIVVIGVLSIIMTMGFTTLSKSNGQLSLNQAQADLVFALEEAQNRAATGFGTENHGVHIEENKFEIFEVGTAGKETTLPLNVSTDKTAGVDVIFNRITASTGADTTITIKHSNGDTKEIKIASNGKISAQ